MKSGSRWSPRGLVICTCLLFGLSFAAVSQSTNGRYLALNSWTRGSVAVGDGRQTATYQIIVRDDVFSIEVELAESPADLDLFLNDPGGELVTYSELTSYNETLYLSRATDPPLHSGRFTLEVVYQFDRPPTQGGRRLASVPFRIRVAAAKLEPLATLRPGRQVSGLLLPENGMTALYRIELPRDADALRVDISDTDADVDLFLFEGDVPADIFQAEHIVQTLRSAESLVVSADSYPPLRGGHYHVLVIDQVTRDQEASFKLSVSSDVGPPRNLARVPDIPRAGAGLARALLATVEVLNGSGGGGSGTLVSGDGFILTNWHVVEGPDGAPDPDVTIGISLDHTRPPVELFRAQVVEFSRDRDLALLQITGNRYGGQLPALELPFVEISTVPVAIADDLQFVGYPGIGGTGSRASVTYTRGVVSGFQQTSYGYDIKTDGEINSGSSGGAALDADFRLVGIPTSIVGEASGQIAYVVPVSALPADWMVYIR
jgi:S1-C subfamily serine protease